MGINTDLSLFKFGKLTPIQLLPSGGKNYRKWQCLCDCGNMCTAKTTHLISGRTHSCGCARVSDITNQRFGRLIAKGRVVRRNKKISYWKCICDCGNITEVTLMNLKEGRTLSCGCYKTEKTSEIKLKHGMSRTPLYNIWVGMIQRCKTDGNNIRADYGGRGITVYPGWVNSFEEFYAYVGDRPEGKTLDRIDPNGNYEPGNVRWATPVLQAVNRNIRSDNTTGVIGVRKLKDGKFHAGLDLNGESKLSKTYHSFDEAVEARRLAVELYHKPLLDTE